MKLIHCPQAMGPYSWAHIEQVLNCYFDRAGYLYKTLCPPAKHMAELEPCDILYTQAEFALEVLQKAQAKIKIIQRDSAHSSIRKRMFEAENKRLGITWDAVPDAHDSRAVAEYVLADYIVVLSNVVRNGFLAEGFAPEQIRVITPGVDTTRFKPGKRIDDGIFRVRCAGILGPRKGIAYLLDAWDKLKLPNAELVITGTKREVNGHWVLEDHYKQYNFTNVKLSPFLDRPKHEQFYHECDLHVLPSLEEGLATVTLESMASGLPQIVTEEAGVTDIWTEECGKIVPSRNVEALMHSLKYYYDNRDVGIQHGAIARRLVEPYTWGRFGTAVVQFLGEII